MNACTIVARNYLAYARVLAASYARHHRGERLAVLVIDAEAAPFDAGAEAFETILPSQLPIAASEFRKMAAMYDVMELATAVKPALLRFLLGRGADAAMFLDPDIEVFTPLDDLGERARAHGIVLVPHMRRPIPDDDKKPTQADLAASGVYNLGFIAVSGTAGDFLDWWEARLRRDCLVAPEDQLFVDQRLLDFLPGYRSPYIVHDPGCDVAYWNLHERRVTRTGDRYHVGDGPLRFFHFSGFNPASAHLLSKHQGGTPRILLSEEPDLARLCRGYSERLLRQGHRECASLRYGFADTAGGVPFDRRMRRLYREGLLAAEHGGGPEPPDPLDPAQADDFVAWLNQPADGSVGPTRYLRRLYDERADLRAAFADLSGPDLQRFGEWVRADGRADPPVPEIFRVPMPTRRTADRPGPEPRSSSDGVNISGYVRAELGTGEGARLTIAAVKAAGLPYSVIAYGETSSRQAHPFDDFGAESPTYDVNLLHINADMLPKFAERYGRELLTGRYTVGIWAWEIESFPPDMAAAERYADEIWAVSEFSAAAIARSVSKPVYAFPHPVIPPTPPALTRAQLGLPDGFLFLFCFDFFSVMERKNPHGIIEAFVRAFTPNEGPTLVIKSINGARVIDQLETLRSLAAGRSDIRIIDGYLPQPHVHALMNSCDVYVSLHRGEGFGLTMAEAMALGKPVIATGYSGNLDFMNEGNSYLVPYELVPIPPGCDPYPSGARWAAPSASEAARLMRYVYDHRDEAGKIGQRAREDILRLHAPEARAAFVQSRLAAIRRTWTPSVRGEDVPARISVESYEATVGSTLLSATADLVAAPPPLGSRHAAVRLIQRGLLRLLRPLLNHQRAIGDKLIEAVAEIARGFDRDRHRFDRDRQKDLAELQREHQEALAELQRVIGRRRAEILDDIARRRDEYLQAISREVADGTARATADLATKVASLGHAVDGVRRRDETRLAALERVSASTAADVRQLLAELHATAYVWDPSLVSGLADARGRATIGYHSATDGPSPVPYLRFEEMFRGPEALIKERQRPYVDVLRGHTPIVDVGCGRGELLDLCREAGLSAVGVDRDAGMVARCRAKGHRVECGDALAYLESQPDGSIGAIVSAQFIEHLPYERLIQFLQLAYRKLAGPGLFVAETMNPHSIQAFKAFWTDLTHERPIFPETLLALCRVHGFEEASILFPTGTDDLQADRWSQGDYAVVARRGVARA
jgi:glycosyltransferase involved in cell wall biosynthesis